MDMIIKEWTPEFVKELVLFFVMYGESKDGVNKTIVKSVTSSNAISTRDIALDNENINIDSVRHIITPHYPTYNILALMPEGDVFKGECYSLDYATAGQSIHLECLYEEITNIIESNLDECTNEIEKEYLQECAEKCRKLAKGDLTEEERDLTEEEPQDLISKIEKKIKCHKETVNWSMKYDKEELQLFEEMLELAKQAQGKE